MIAVDTSALLAALLGEAGGPECRAVLRREVRIVVSAGTLSEAFIIAHRRGIEAALSGLLEEAAIEVEPVTETVARQVGSAHARWGKGVHPAGLHFGDCFAYALAKERDLALLFVGKDFARTDIRPAIGA